MVYLKRLELPAHPRRRAREACPHDYFHMKTPTPETHLAEYAPCDMLRMHLGIYAEKNLWAGVWVS